MRPSLFLTSILLSLFCSFNMANTELTTNAIERVDPTPLKIVVGGYSGKIVSLEFDPAKKTFQNLSATTGDSSGKAPSFIGFSPDGQCMFASNEVSDFRGLAKTGSVASFKIGKDNTIQEISTALTGADPAALAVSPDGKNLITAEYSGGSWSRHPLNNHCGFQSETPAQTMKYHGSGPNKERQDQSYIHQVTYNHAGDLVFFVDLGGDSVYIHRVDRATGAVGDLAHEIKLPAGSGPRHLTIREKHQEYDIFLISELANKMFTIRLTDQDNKLESTIRQQLDTLPKSATNRSSYGAGEVMLSRDGRFLYATNRQTDFTKPITDNSIVVFKRDLHSGLLIETSPVWFPIPVGGSTPRHFSLSNDRHQAFMVVGCQQSNTLLMFHRRSYDGTLNFMASTFVESPAVQLFIPDTEAYITYD
ncbi:hypothetical protein Pst134EA_004953 [Puccinia striiformis f. sp. tritici]|nr:hypothetical protein Pst134EA_004953 [Puccinia striiformis f. sp. tritici]KAH9462109.1 hypothetical protein Pst134EB_006027 [Puccinia striiformis f. sp. tritici]KAH9471044.1 hypothetical protein Pst134EA_004953 [Puccinia striiformis f. sp. tritici]